MKSAVTFLLFAALILQPLRSAWMEELSLDNTQEDQTLLENAAPSSAPKTGSAQVDLGMKYAVTLIEATLLTSEPAAEIRWMDIDDPAARYKVWRSTEPINSEAALMKAKNIGTVGSGVQVFKDVFETAGQYYYAVTTVSEGAEHKIFMLEQSFTTSPVLYRADTRAVHVSELKAFFNQFLGSVFIRWNDPQSSEPYSVLIYRSREMIDTLEKAQSAALVTAAGKGDEKFQDRQVVPGEIYYYAAVIQLKSRKDLENVFISGANFTSVGIRAEEKMGEVAFEELPDATPQAKTKKPGMAFGDLEEDMKAAEKVKKPGMAFGDLEEDLEAQEKAPQKAAAVTKDLKIDYNAAENYVSLVWIINRGLDAPFYINVYRSSEVIQNVSELSDSKKLLESIPERSCRVSQRYEWRDYNVEPGAKYYYAVLVDTGSGIEDQNLYLLDNYIKYPVRIPAGAKAAVKAADPEVRNVQVSGRTRLREAVSSLFLTKQYRWAADEFLKIEKEESLDADSRKMLYMYLGRSYLALRETQRALSAFRKLEGIDPELGAFWIDKTIEEYR